MILYFVHTARIAEGENNANGNEKKNKESHFTLVICKQEYTRNKQNKFIEISANASYLLFLFYLFQTQRFLTNK